MGRKPGIIMDDQPAEPRRPRISADVPQAWRWIGWFGLVLSVVGVGDWVLAWVPMRLGSPEWEFGTIAATTAGLPLTAMGFAALLGAAIARGIRWQVITMGWVLLVWAIVVFGAVLIFMLDVPLALRAVEGTAHLGIIKATIKTVFLGLVFSVAFGVAGFGALRHSRGSEG